MNLLLVGNCQVVGLRDLLSAALPDVEVDAWEVWDKTPEQIATLAGLVDREKAVDVKFVDELVAEVRMHHSFHVFNHPTIGLLQRYAARIVDMLFPGTPLDERISPPQDRLALLGSFPVYASVREHLNLCYGQPHFTTASAGGPVVLEPREFIARSYEIYAQQPADKLVSPDVCQG